jgi:hypothetical protein
LRNWKQKPDPDSLIFISPRAAANVIISSQPVPRALEPNELARIQLDEFARDAEISKTYRRREFTPIRLLGHATGFLHHFTWTAKESRVIQWQIYYVEAGTGYFMTLTAIPELRGAERLAWRFLRGLGVVRIRSACG